MLKKSTDVVFIYRFIVESLFKLLEAMAEAYRVFVGGLPHVVTEGSLLCEVLKYTALPPTKIEIIRKRSAQHQPFALVSAFVSVQTPEDQSSLIQGLHLKSFFGYMVTANVAVPRNQLLPWQGPPPKAPSQVDQMLASAKTGVTVPPRPNRPTHPWRQSQTMASCPHPKVQQNPAMPNSALQEQLVANAPVPTATPMPQVDQPKESSNANVPGARPKVFGAEGRKAFQKTVSWPAAISSFKNGSHRKL